MLALIHAIPITLVQCCMPYTRSPPPYLCNRYHQRSCAALCMYKSDRQALLYYGCEVPYTMVTIYRCTVQSKSSDPLSKLLQQNTGHYKDTPISSIFDLWQLTLSFWLSLDAFTTIESEICEKCEQIKKKAKAF